MCIQCSYDSQYMLRIRVISYHTFTLKCYYIHTVHGDGSLWVNDLLVIHAWIRSRVKVYWKSSDTRNLWVYMHDQWWQSIRHHIHVHVQPLKTLCHVITHYVILFWFLVYDYDSENLVFVLILFSHGLHSGYKLVRANPSLLRLDDTTVCIPQISHGTGNLNLTWVGWYRVLLCAATNVYNPVLLR